MSKNLVGRCKFEDKLNINSDIIQCLNTKYYSKEMHKAAFTMPKFTHKFLK